MITRVTCRNYRCLEAVEVPLEPITALVGPNGAGKSAVLRALDLIAGPAWPTLQRLRFPHDFTAFDDRRHLSIKVDLAESVLTEPDKVGAQHHIDSLRLQCKPYKRRTASSVAGDPNFDFDPLDAIGQVPLECVAASGLRPTQQRPHRVTTPMRDAAACVLIDHRRGIEQHQPGRRGSVLTRLLEPALRDLDRSIESEEPRTKRQVFAERYEHAAEVLRTPYVEEIEATIDATARRTLGFMGATSGRNASVGFEIADPINPYSSLQIVYREDGLVFPAEEVGLGIQSAIVVGIFEALRAQQTGIGIVLIDEPEMYLHPQAQRHFHRILCELAERGGTQVVYSTHSPVFADAYRFESLRLVRRPGGGHSSIQYVAATDRPALAQSKAVNRLLTEYDAARSEALFASAVLLVEGKADLIAVRGTAVRLGIDLDECNLTVLECGGKSSIPFHANLCRSLKIPVCALFDDDQLDVPPSAAPDVRSKREKENAAARAATERIVEAIRDADDRFVCHPSLETLTGIGRAADNKPLRMAEYIAAAESRASLPTALVDAVLRLRDLGAPPTRDVPFDEVDDSTERC